jgi:hypothetical protein
MIKNINNIRMCSDLIQAYIIIILSELYAMAIILKKNKYLIDDLKNHYPWVFINNSPRNIFCKIFEN